MTESAPCTGAAATATLRVASSDLANAIYTTIEDDIEDRFPAVLATPRLIALMEMASARVLKPYLSMGQLSVGVTIEVSHTAATPLGATVTAEATYDRSEGKLHFFDIVASDEGGEIGRATHKRAIVSGERIEQGAKKRVTTLS